MIQVFPMKMSHDLINHYKLTDLTGLGHNTLVESFFYTGLHTTLGYGEEESPKKIGGELINLLKEIIDPNKHRDFPWLLAEPALQAVGSRLVEEISNITQEHTIDSYRAGKGKEANYVMLETSYEC